MDVDDRLESLRRRPQPPLAGVFQHEPEDDGFVYRDVQLRLRHYTSACLGAHADITEAPAAWTKWERPPVELTRRARRDGGGCVPPRRASAAGWWPRCADVALRGCGRVPRSLSAAASSRRSSTRRCSTTSASTTRASPRPLPVQVAGDDAAGILRHPPRPLHRTDDGPADRARREAADRGGDGRLGRRDGDRPVREAARTQAAVNLLCKLNPEVELWRDMMRVNEKRCRSAARR